MRRLFIAIACGAGCAHTDVNAGSALLAPPATPIAAGTANGAAPAEAAPLGCGERPREVARLTDKRLDEISGVVESRKNPAVLFVHNDSGDSPRFFALDRQGRVLAELTLPSVPLVIDAEEIAIGPAPDGGTFVYLGDTGNNFASFGQGIPRRKAALYRVPEPDIPLSARALQIPLTDVWPIVFTFPDGARDVEAFFVDPSSGDMYLLSKEPKGKSQVLRASAAQLAGGGGPLQLVGELALGHASEPGSNLPTAASVSRDGSRILVRTYSTVLLFRRSAGESVMSALGRAPQQLEAPHEQQGEAISFVDADSAFLTISEGVKPAIQCAKLPANVPISQ